MEVVPPLREAAGLKLGGRFLNAGKTFDVMALRQACARRDIEANPPRNRRAVAGQSADDTPLVPALYPRHQVIEQLHAWLDGFKSLLIRSETCLHTWLSFHWLAFSVLLRKIGRQPTS